MSESRAARGRPKGSGLDDRAQLIAVARLMAADPDLKPTTAIKSTGVSDPSTIRRLRDKFHALREELVVELAEASHVAKPGAAKAAPKAAAAAKAASDKKRSPAVVAAVPAKVEQAASALNVEPVQPCASDPDPAVAAAPSVATLQSGPSDATAPLPPSPAAWLTLLYGLGVQNVTAIAAYQISFLEKVMRMPHVATALRGQVALNEMTLALYPASAGRFKTVH